MLSFSELWSPSQDSQQEVSVSATHSLLSSLTEQWVYWAGSDPHRKKRWRSIWVRSPPLLSFVKAVCVGGGGAELRVKTVASEPAASDLTLDSYLQGLEDK